MCEMGALRVRSDTRRSINLILFSLDQRPKLSVGPITERIMKRLRYNYTLHSVYFQRSVSTGQGDGPAMWTIVNVRSVFYC